MESNASQVSFQDVDIKERALRKSALQKYHVKTAVNADGKPIFVEFHYPNGRVLSRSIDKAFFKWGGEKTKPGSLFGQDVWPAGSSKAITITEGAFDAVAVYQMQGYPAVAVSSTGSAKKECSEAYEYLNSFDKIYLCFDADTPGKEAMADVARMFDFNKVYMVNLSEELNDPNNYLKANKTDDFNKIWWNAKRFLPEGILSTYDEFDRVIDEDVQKPSVPYPFIKLQEMTYGIRSGEMVLFTAQEGIGKTEMFRVLEHHLLRTTDDRIGIIHLEENKARTIKGLVGYEVQAPIHLPDFTIPNGEIKTKFRELTRSDERVHIYSHFGSDDPDIILSTIRFLAGSCGCKYVFLDHITMVVTGLQGDDERRALDYISTRLAMMVEELDFTLFLISHVNDAGQTRGSRNIGKVADLRIDLHRDLTADNEMQRNTTNLVVSKNRYVGKTGPAGRLWFNADTFTLNENTEELPH
jgi:twinkle protein